MPDDFQIPTNAAEAESLIEGFQEPSVEQESAPETPAAQEYKLNYKGKEETYPLEKLIEFAQQGRDYTAKMTAYNAEKAGYLAQTEAQKAKWAALEQKVSRYGEVETFIEKDPQGKAWWDHVPLLIRGIKSWKLPWVN